MSRSAHVRVAPHVEALDLNGLKRLGLRLLEEVAGLKAENAASREEIARLKGFKSPPKFKAGSMVKVPEVKPAGAGRRDVTRARRMKQTSSSTRQVDVPNALECDVPPYMPW